MARSNHHGCGRTCGMCRPHKKWRSNKKAHLTVRDQKALESAEYSLIDDDVEWEEPKPFVDEKKARINDLKRTAIMVGMMDAIKSNEASMGDVARIIEKLMQDYALELKILKEAGD